MKLTNLKPSVRTLGAGIRTLGRDNAAPRLRGRAAMDRRAAYLTKHPLCVECAKTGRTTMGDVIDHTTPLWAGGADDYASNGQTLCHPHHDAKTACEAAMRAAGGWRTTPCTCGLHRSA